MFLKDMKKLFFKATCAICNAPLKEKEYDICEKCFFEIERVSSIKKEMDLYYFLHYNDHLKSLVFKYKYGSIKDISHIYSRLFKRKLLDVLASETVDVIIPVPIHEKRENSRGFNQVEEILKALKYPYLKVKRIENTQAMHHFHEAEDRRKNISGAFEISDGRTLLGKNIAIVDDIYTTGATMKELEASLKKFKPKKIIKIAFFRSRRVKS